MTKYAASALTLAAVLLMPVAAEARPDDMVCKLTNNKAKGCDQPKTVPEPGDLLLLSSGLASLGTMLLLRRRARSK
jgi:hypothetical protein